MAKSVFAMFSTKKISPIDETGKNKIHLAVLECNLVNIARRLAKYSGDINNRDHSGFTAFHYVFTLRDVVRKIDKKHPWEYRQQNTNPIKFATADIEKLKPEELLDSLIHYINHDLRTSPDNIKKLIDTHINKFSGDHVDELIHRVDKNKLTAEHKIELTSEMMKKYRAEMLDLFLRCEHVDPNIRVEHKDPSVLYNGMAPIHLAAKLGRSLLMTKLLAHTQVQNNIDLPTIPKGNTALMVTLINMKDDMLQDRYDSIVQRRNIVRSLIAQDGIVISKTNNESEGGDTALHIAIRNEDSESVLIITGHKAACRDLYEITNRAGQTPYTLAEHLPDNDINAQIKMIIMHNNSPRMHAQAASPVAIVPLAPIQQPPPLYGSDDDIRNQRDISRYGPPSYNTSNRIERERAKTPPNDEDEKTQPSQVGRLRSRSEEREALPPRR